MLVYVYWHLFLIFWDVQHRVRPQKFDKTPVYPVETTTSTLTNARLKRWLFTVIWIQRMVLVWKWLDTIVNQGLRYDIGGAANHSVKLGIRGGKCIGPQDHWSQKTFGVARKYSKFQKQKRVYWPDINVNFSLAENIFNLKMTRDDALINRTPPPHTHTHTPWRNVGIYGEWFGVL